MIVDPGGYSWIFSKKKKSIGYLTSAFVSYWDKHIVDRRRSRDKQKVKESKPFTRQALTCANSCGSSIINCCFNCAIKYAELKDETVLIYIPVAESTPAGSTDWDRETYALVIVLDSGQTEGNPKSREPGEDTRGEDRGSSFSLSIK